MLRHLSIREFALIEHVECDFDRGMTVLLGETGAGKSIIIDALAAALGERMSADQVRSGARKAVIEATFASDDDVLHDLLREHELTWENDEIVFRRELLSSGTSRCFVNDTPTQAGVVRRLAERLMDFHGQHDTHGLLHPSRHVDILDAAGGLATTASGMASAWADVVTARRALDALRARAATADDDRARHAFALQEIDAIDPKPGEDEEIAAELRRAESSEMVVHHATALRDLLYAGEASAYDRLNAARQHLEVLAPFAPSLERYRTELDASLASCEEAAKEAAPFADPEDFSAERLEEMRSRLALLQRLVRKHGSIDAARSEADRLRDALNDVEHLDEAITEAERMASTATKAATTLAASLTTKRNKASKALATHVTDALHGMGMPAAVFNVDRQSADLGPHGADRIEFLFSSNTGEMPRPLSKVASGGELSRVMLAIKHAMAASGAVGTMVFDEIDTGISGRVARHVGDVMKELADRHQILCITHLPQIASLAEQIIRVTKTEHAGMTSVHAETVRGNEAVVEIARLMSGVTVTDAALDSARELMSTVTKR